MVKSTAVDVHRDAGQAENQVTRTMKDWLLFLDYTTMWAHWDDCGLVSEFSQGYSSVLHDMQKRLSKRDNRAELSWGEFMDTWMQPYIQTVVEDQKMASRVTKLTWNLGNEDVKLLQRAEHDAGNTVRKPVEWLQFMCDANIWGSLLHLYTQEFDCLQAETKGCSALNIMQTKTSQLGSKIHAQISWPDFVNEFIGKYAQACGMEKGALRDCIYLVHRAGCDIMKLKRVGKDKIVI